MRSHPARTLLLAAAATLLAADPPSAAFVSFNDWIGSETQGVRIGADGRVRLAPGSRRVAQLPEGVIWAAVPDGTGGAYLSAGNEGKIFKYTNGQVTPVGQVKGGIVFAMARLGQDLIVAPTGEGRLFRMSPNGDVKPFAEMDLRLVWAMTVQGGEVLVAGGNEKGAALVTAREGSSRKLAVLADETAFTCLQPDGQGGWYLGTHGHGLVVHHAGSPANDRVDTLLSTGFEEVRALHAQEGYLYAGATNGLSSRLAGGSLELREQYLSDPGGSAKSAVIRLDRDRAPLTLWQSAQSQVFALTPWKGNLLIGTGNRARVFSIPLAEADRAEIPFCLLQDLGAAQASAFLQAGSDLLVVASNPAELHVLSETQGTVGTLESRVLKAAPIADWGRAYLEADTPSGTTVDLQVRTGSTETPDGTWGPWSPPLRSGERPNLKPARFAQFRLRLSSTRGGASPIVEGVTTYWANRNLPPRWENVDIMPPGLVITRTSPPEDIGIERIPFETQKLIPALGYSGSEKRSFRRGAQAFVFKVSDPNQDQLAFQVRLLPDKGSPILLEKAWKERFFTFDTLPVPDGRYRLEILATDAPSQPFNAALTSLWKTPPFVVDHTPPVIIDLSATPEGEGVRVRFLARDEGSVLKEMVVSADGDRWLQLQPEDRVFDAREERADVLLPKDMVRGDRILVRAVDACNNEQAASVLIQESRRR